MRFRPAQAGDYSGGAHRGYSFRGFVGHVIERVTQVLVEVDDDRRRMYQSPDAWVHLVEVPDGGWGALGRVMGHADVVDLIRSSSLAVRAESCGAA